MNYVKFLTNKRESIHFKFDSGLEKDGKFGMQYAYGVTWNGEEAYLYATEALNRLLQSINPLKNRTLQIEKAQDPKDLKRTYWIIYDENGAEITPKSVGQSPTPVPTQTPAVAQNTASQGHCSCNERLDKASKAFAILRTEFSALQDKVKSLEILVEEVAGKQATDLHTSLKNRDIRESKNPSLEDAAKIVDSYKSDPTIPTINEVPKGFDK